MEVLWVVPDGISLLFAFASAFAFPLLFGEGLG